VTCNLQDSEAGDLNLKRSKIRVSGADWMMRRELQGQMGLRQCGAFG
jgi:hypothetical protein